MNVFKLVRLWDQMGEAQCKAMVPAVDIIEMSGGVLKMCFHAIVFTWHGLVCIHSSEFDLLYFNSTVT